MTAFARPAFGDGDGVEREAADEIVRQGAELMPGAVAPRGEDVEGELALPVGE